MMRCLMAGTIVRKKNSKTSDAIRQDLVFTCVLGALKKWCPPAKPVKIIIRNLPDGILGACRVINDSFVIRLNKEMGPSQAVDVLTHEWAHALSWSYMHDRMIANDDREQTQESFDWLSHDEAWGCAYAKTYRAYQDGSDIAAKLKDCKSDEARTQALHEMIMRGTRKRGFLL